MMQTALFALLIGVPVGVGLSMVQYVLARRHILRGLRSNPPPAGLPHRERYFAKPVLATLGVVFPLTLLVSMCIAATLVAYLALIR